MATTKTSLHDKVLAEIEQIPAEYYSLLLQFIRAYRESVVLSTTPRKPRQPGSARDKILSMSADFDAPMEEFKEYME